MTTSSTPENPLPVQDDRILRQTRIVLIVVVPFLLLAFLILYFFPDLSGERFAWGIKPHMTALFIGSGYLAGAYMFVFAIFGKHWHRVKGAFPPVTAFTVSMLLATIIHWDRFDIHHFPFQLWLILYVVTPFIVPYLWIKNRVTDPGTPEAGDLIVPTYAKWAFMAFGGLGIGMGIFMFILPQPMIAIWPWALSPLTARILAGWFGLLGVGGFYVSQDSRWSVWQVPLQSITFWGILILIGAFINPQDFSHGVWNPFTIGTLVVILLLAAFQIGMKILHQSQYADIS
jgi:hypothetical protein